MVMAGKVFLVKEDVELKWIAAKLKGFRVEEGGEEQPLLREVEELRWDGKDLAATFAQDQLMEVYHRGESTETPYTTETPVVFTEHGNRVFLIVVEKKPLANRIANQLSRILFIDIGRIVEAKIDPEAFRHFHEENFEDTKIVFFDEVDIPGVSKLSLYGTELGDTGLYHDYLKHGKIWYIVIKPRGYSSIVGVTRNCVVTFFSQAEVRELVEYVKEEILPRV